MFALSNGSPFLDDRLGCFGDFEADDPVCLKHCALSIKCAIERERNVHMEILEDMFIQDDVHLKIQ